MKHIYYLLIFFLPLSFFAQNVGINASGAAPNASAMLDVNANNKGVLIPNVALTSTSSAGPITTPATSLLVYNTATVSDVTPGYYFWNGTAWQRFDTGNNTGDWKLTGNAGTNGGNITTAGVNFLGTTDLQNLCFRTANTERGRFSNLGEFCVGTFNTAIAGDLSSVVSNTTFPWALNGYSSFNGAGVYGLIQGGNTLYAGVQGEYYGTNSQGAGVRGLIGNTTAGTSFNVSVNGVNGSGAVSAATAGTYKFGVYGAGGYSGRSGGVFGNNYGITFGALGYFTSGGANTSVYGFGVAYTAGLAGGRYSGGSVFQDFDQPNNTIGLGIYGGVLGGWIKGLVYGTNFSGQKYGIYVHGSAVTNSKYVQLNNINSSQNRVASYANTSLTNELTGKGKIQLVNGSARVIFDEIFTALCDSSSIVITATPMGNCNGIYIEDSNENGFTITELNNGHSNIIVSYNITGTLKNAKPFIESEILNSDYEINMEGVMHNEYDTSKNATPIWFDGQKIRHDAVDPSIIKRQNEDFTKIFESEKRLLGSAERRNR